MRGSVIKEPNGTYTVVYDAGEQPRHECTDEECGWRAWADSHVRTKTCPDCDSEVLTAMHRRQIKKRGFAKKTGPDGADTWLAEQIRTVERGVHVEPKKITLREFVEGTWIPSLTVSPSTEDFYEQIMRTRVLPILGEVRLQALDAPRVVSMLTQLEKSGGRYGHGLSPKSLRHTYYTLNAAMNDALRWEYVARNPLEKLKAPPVPERDMKVWDRTEMKEFLDWIRSQDLLSPEEMIGSGRLPRVVHGRRLLPMWELLFTTGMRREELLGIRWSDIDWDGGALSIEWVIVDPKKHEYVLKRPKSNPRAKDNTSRRKLKLDPETLDALRWWRRRQMAERMAAGSEWIEDLAASYEFVYPDGRPDSQDLVFRMPDGAIIDGRWLSSLFPRSLSSPACRASPCMTRGTRTRR